MDGGRGRGEKQYWIIVEMQSLIQSFSATATDFSLTKESVSSAEARKNAEKFFSIKTLAEK